MKRLTVIAMAVVMIVCALALPASALSANGTYGEVPLYKGGITIDGKADAIYAQGLTLDCSEDYKASFATDTTAKITLLHDGAYLYVLVDVKSGNPLTDYNPKYASAAKAWNTTSAEVMIDWSNDAAGENDIYKLMGWFNNNIYGDFLAAGKESAVVADYKATVDKDAKTWTAEFKLNFMEDAKTGSEIGFNVMIDSDANMGAANDAKRQICSMVPEVSNHGDKYKNVTLSTKEIKAPEATTAATTKAPAATGSSAQTFDAAVVLAVVAAAAGAGVVVSGKRK